jgi:drug/metabolite transporter (DMT)-like permease
VLWPLPADSLAAIAALGLIPTVVGHTLVQAGARTLSPSLVALVCPGETLGSIAIAMVVWRKPPTIEEAIGGAVILAGAVIAIRAQRHD